MANGTQPVPILEFSILGNGTDTDSTQNNPSRLINLMDLPGQGDTGNKGVYLRKTPGTSLFTQLSSSNIRGLLEINDTIYTVAGADVIIVSRTGTSTVVGQLNTFTGRVSMVTDGNGYIFIDDGIKGYQLVINTGALTVVSDGDYTPSGFIIINAYRVIYAKPNSNQIWFSDLNNYLSYDALSYATAESIKSDLVCVFDAPNDILLMGRNKSEAWVLGTDSTVPYSKRIGVSIPYGCLNRWTVAKNGNNVIWLSKTQRGQLQIVSLDTNYNTTVLTSQSALHELENLTTYTDAYAYTFTMYGIDWYSIHFPTDNKSYLLNLNTGTFLRWSSWYINGILASGDYDYSQGRHLSTHLVALSDTLIVADYRSGRLLYLDKDIYSDYSAGVDNSIYCEAITPILYSKLKYISLYKVAVDMQVGSSSLSASEVTASSNVPVLRLACSKDGGKTFPYERQRNIGYTGEYDTRVSFNKWGILRNGSLRLAHNSIDEFSLFNIFVTIGVSE